MRPQKLHPKRSLRWTISVSELHYVYCRRSSIIRFVCIQFAVNRRARKAILIVLSLVVLSSTQGFFLLVAYVTEIFESTSSNLTAIESSIVITSILIVGNLIVFNIIDRVGRRILYLSSSVFTTLALITFAIYLRTFADNTALAWVPIVSVSFIIFVSSLGMIPVPFLVMVEILPKKVHARIESMDDRTAHTHTNVTSFFPQIQHYGITAFIGTQYTIVFLMCEAYPPLKAHIGLFGWIVFFIVMCVGNIVFAIFVVPETKGKSHDVIMQMLDWKTIKEINVCYLLNNAKTIFWMGCLVTISTRNTRHLSKMMTNCLHCHCIRTYRELAVSLSANSPSHTLQYTLNASQYIANDWMIVVWHFFFNFKCAHTKSSKRKRIHAYQCTHEYSIDRQSNKWLAYVRLQVKVQKINRKVEFEYVWIECEEQSRMVRRHAVLRVCDYLLCKNCDAILWITRIDRTGWS